MVIACDVTGSMGDWPATIFSKLPYLDLEGKEYLGEDMEISFAAIGDLYTDKYPIQVREFVSGKDLEKVLKKLIIEGNGGGQSCESYEAAAYYYANFVEIPNALKPIFIFIGDENIYDKIYYDDISKFVDLKNHKSEFNKGVISTQELINELQRKFSVYIIRKPYGSETDSTNLNIQSNWEKLLGPDHVLILPDAKRVVDVIFGILAKETGRIEYFTKEITDRQKPDQVATVMKSLVSIHKLGYDKDLEEDKDTSKSVTRRKNSRKLENSRSLI